MAKAIIFDLDGCLVESEVLSLATLSAEAQRLGADEIAQDEMAREVLGLKMAHVAEWVARRAGRPVPGDFAARIDAMLMDRYPADLRAVTGAPDMLAALARQGLPMAVATGSSTERMALALRVTGLAPFFEGTACSVDAVENGKPAPDLFLHAAGIIGQPPARCLVLEDSPHGVEGARAAGMTPVGFVGGDHLAERRDAHAETLMAAGCHMVVRDLAEFQRLALAG